MNVNYLVKDWAWRVNDGMPDPKNRNHLELLEATLRAHKYSDEFIFILICNTIYTGNAMMAAPNAKLDDGLLDVIILNKTITRFKLLQLLPTLFKGEHINSPYVKYKQVKKIVLEPKNNEILNIDGEIMGSTPIQVNVIPKAFEMFVS